jgi:hypothetical protein
MDIPLLDDWRFFTKDIVSPDTYIEAGFFYMISAALQRRVWLGDRLAALYPNQYIILIGEPGVGKGMILKQVIEILKFHKMKDDARASTIKDTPKGVEQRPRSRFDDDKPILMTPEEMRSFNLLAAVASDAANIDPIFSKDRPLEIPIGAEATTYEALCLAISKSKRMASYPVSDGNGGFKDMALTTSSMCFCLEEISSLFRKHTEDTVNLLLTVYDCGDYTYQTKTQGISNIKRCCVSIIGGTTPGFVKRVFGDELLTEGFASRAIFVFESANRFQRLLIPQFDAEQLLARQRIIDHVGKLVTLKGAVTYEKEAWDFLNNWWCKIHPIHRPNLSQKLNPYYARKNIHVQKMALAVHFARSTDFTLKLEECEYALEFLDKLERRMHFALSFENKNPLADLAKEILRTLRKEGPKTRIELLLSFFGEGKDADIAEAITFLQQTGQVVYKPIKREGSSREEHCYKVNLQLTD